MSPKDRAWSADFNPLISPGLGNNSLASTAHTVEGCMGERVSCRGPTLPIERYRQAAKKRQTRQEDLQPNYLLVESLVGMLFVIFILLGVLGVSRRLGGELLFNRQSTIANRQFQLRQRAPTTAK